MIKISIILPVYNTAKYLEKCLKALADQTLHEIEILCVDDGSTDDSYNILQKYADLDCRFRIFKQSHLGPAAARNIGLNYALAPYIMFCDADDWYEPDYCRIMYEIMENNQVDVAVCHTNLVFEDKNDYLRRQGTKEELYNSSYEGKLLLDHCLLHKTSVVLWNKIFRKSIIEEQEIFFPDGCDHEDDAFWILYGLQAQTIFFLSKKLYNYRIRPNSIMSSYFIHQPKNKYERFKICNFVYNILKRKNILNQKLSVVSEFFKRQMEMMFFELFSPQELQSMAFVLNRYQKDYIFIENKGQIFIAPLVGIQAANKILFIKYWLLSKICIGFKRKEYKEKRKIIRNQIKIKKIINKKYSSDFNKYLNLN